MCATERSHLQARCMSQVPAGGDRDSSGKHPQPALSRRPTVSLAKAVLIANVSLQHPTPRRLKPSLIPSSWTPWCAHFPSLSFGTTSTRQDNYLYDQALKHEKTEYQYKFTV